MSPKIILLPCTLINSIYIKYSFITFRWRARHWFDISTWGLHDGSMRALNWPGTEEWQCPKTTFYRWTTTTKWRSYVWVQLKTE